MTVRYPDVSGFQAGLSLAGAALVVAKATEGGTFTDASYAGFRAQAGRLGVPFAAYHWINGTAAATQAAHAFAVIGSGTPVMWDAEATGATVGQILAVTAAYRRLGGRATLCYLPHWWWQQIGSPDLRPLAAAGLALVSSNYPAAGYSDTGPGWAAYGGLTPAIWQYTDTALFNGRRVDFNAYRGTQAQLLALVGLTTPGGTNMTDTVLEWNTGWRLQAILHEQDPIVVPANAAIGAPGFSEANLPLQRNKQLTQDVAAIKDAVAGIASPVLTDAQLATLAAQVTAAIAPQLDALRRDVADLRARLAAGAQASHDALSG